MIRFVLTGVACCWAVAATASVDIQQVTTRAGHSAWLVEEPSIPFVALELRFKGGASLDPEGKRGVTHLMTGLLEEGAGDLDAQGFAAASESLAATFSYSSGDDALAVSARFLTENRDEAMALLRESLINPRFDDAAIARVKGQILSSIQSDKTDPDAIAGKRATEILYGDHPYGSAKKGTEESLAGLTRDDILAARDATLVTERVYIGAAGDISADELSQLIDALLEGLPETGPPLPDDVRIETEAETIVVPFDTPQSVAVFGHRFIPRDDPDFFAAFVINQILGSGGFESRLMEEVRDKRGLTYGVYSYIANRDNSDMIMGRVASANDRIAEAVTVIRDEWRRMAEEGVSQEELDAAKTYLTGAYPLRFDGNGPIADILVGMQVQGLTPDYILTRNDRVNAVTAEDVKRVAKRVLLPDELLFVVVGQPEGLGGAVTQ
ncbi:M16 family metallopeptidase [Roseivivax sp. CAU 1753]